MKKTVFILSAVFALVACSKEKPVTQNDGPIDPSKVVFNFTVKHSDDTKGIKTGWVDGDVVYVFFSGNTSQCVKLTRNSGDWDFSDKDGGITYAGLTLASSGNVTAVYANAATPSIDGVITFGGAQPGYLLTATAGYTVTSTTDVTTLSAELIMRAPANLIQVYVPGLSAPASGNEYVLNMTNVQPFTVGSIIPGSAVSITTGRANFPLQGVDTTVGGDSGYYFWGILNNNSLGTIDYNFQVVEQNAVYKYAISSMSKTGSATLIGPKAIKLTSLTDNGKFVSLGYNPLWATGNLDKTNATIVDPLETGEYFLFGGLDPNTEGVSPYTGGNADPISEVYDAAYQTNSAWRIPTYSQLSELHSTYTKPTYTTLGGSNPGYLLTSNRNGISLFLLAAGAFEGGTSEYVGEWGCYWSSCFRDGAVNITYIDPVNGLFSTDDPLYINYVYSIRPVMN